MVRISAVDVLADQDRISPLLDRLKDWSRQWGTPGLERRIQVELSSRMRTSLGRARPSSKLIRLNAALVEYDSSVLEEVLCHEAAHVAVHELHRGYRRPHGPEWRELMRIAEFEPRVRMALVPPLPGSQPRHLYKHQCPVCQAHRTARRPVRRWRCASCVDAGLSGELVITKRPTRGAA